MAIEVLYNLKKDFPNSTLTMVGPDKENLIDDCKKYASELNVEVEFTGKLAKEEWVKLSKDYNVFINTTHFDNTPISVIEAMALGLPVISTKVGGIPFLIQHENEGLLVPSDSAEDMASAIINLVENPEKVKLLTKLARTKVEGFAWNSVKVQWLDLIDNG